MRSGSTCVAGTRRSSPISCGSPGLSIPNEADLAEIESSSRLSSEAAPTGTVLTLSMPLVYRPTEGGHSAPLGIVLAPERLITVRFAPSLVFQNFASQPHEPAEPRSADILIGLFEALVDRQADALEQMRSEIDRMSHHIFHLKLDAAGKLEGARRRQQESELRTMVTTLGRLYDSISLSGIRNSGSPASSPISGRLPSGCQRAWSRG